MNKTNYVAPMIEIVVFQTADIITTSAGWDGEEHDLMPANEDPLFLEW